jgi:hypothetical protein
MTSLSPAALAVWEAFNSEEPGVFVDYDNCHYRSELSDRAHALLDQPEKPTDEELLRMAASAIDPYESSGIAIGEYEPETQCAVEVYGSELIAYAHAVLARWGTPANTTREENLDD